MLTSSSTASAPLTAEADVARFEEFKSGFAPGAVAAASLGPIVLTGAGQIATWFSASGINPGLRLGFAACWLLALATIPLLQLTRVAILRSERARLPKIYWAQSIVQNTWLALLAWYAVPPYAPVLFFVLCVMIFNDTRYLYNSVALKALYGSMWVGQSLLLLLLDTLGGEGLLWMLRNHPPRAAVMLIAEGCVALLSVLIIEVVGSSHRERDLAFQRASNLESTILSMKTERSVLARSCDFLVQGLSAGRFSHDVASPVSVISVEVSRLRELLDEPPGAPIPPRIARCLERIETATEQTLLLTSSLARSLREPPESSAIPIAELVSQAIRHAAASLKRHAIVMREPRVELDESSVVISRDHASAIGNVLVNGVLQQPDQPLEIVGRSVGEYFCRLAVRDWGVLPDQRAEALQRIQSHMALLVEDSATASGMREYSGYGIGLLLTKALVVRGGGWVHAAAPEDGAGLRFEFILPKIAPSAIPSEANTPERMVAGAHNPTLMVSL